MSEQQIRDGNGKFLRTLAGAERQARAADLRSQGLSYRKIAAQMAGEGSATPGYDVKSAYRDVRSALDAVVRESAEQALAVALQQLDDALERLLDARDRLNGQRNQIIELMGHNHSTVSHGKVVYDEVSGEPVPDDEFQLKAHDRLLRVEMLLETNEGRIQANGESRRRLLGLDQPAKTQVSGGVTYQVIGIDPEELR
ncbi:hypothetical protein TR51_06590 [Kitasatospora griseola]|uniref:Uncharacterized protein n=1 Tax=Kitasatospora griseola TaxID=2064 RepID=A0A0D0Q3B2_KITGR|nr:hypothetical protein [Kitasatospora griseola]KIQ67047.1 hypothetical protein TR51_06590 [Kitasatospora griseola]